MSLYYLILQHLLADSNTITYFEKAGSNILQFMSYHNKKVLGFDPQVGLSLHFLVLALWFPFAGQRHVNMVNSSYKIAHVCVWIEVAGCVKYVQILINYKKIYIHL